MGRAAWLAPGVEVRCAEPDDPRGRRVFARKPIVAGTLVLREPAAATALSRERWELHCAGCWARLRGTGKLRCSRCRLVHYCNNRCQLVDWARAHRSECAGLPQLARAAEAEERSSGYAGLAEDALLVGRLVRAWARNAGAQGALEALCHSPSPRLEQAGRVARAAESAGLLADGPALAAPATKVAALALQLASCFDANNFGVNAPLGGGVLGTGCWPTSALLNHSCEPTCALAHVFTPAAAHSASAQPALHCQEIRTIVDCPAGTELAHSYIERGLGYGARLQLLRAGWGIDRCDCARCADSRERRESDPLDGPLLPSAAALNDLSEAANLHAQALLAEEASDEAELLGQVLRLRQRHLDPAHAHVRETHAALLALKLARGELGVARAHAHELVESSRLAYGARPCVSLAISLVTAAELHVAAAVPGDDVGGRALASEALAVLLVTNGAAHPLTRKAAALAGGSDL
ncbi:hypothetical protein T492DRAFT_909636 [Pavlovales sp. CCMP2436]|nr:hypothetical protein T492DRAFT_909636 [Pavlovales sp. CCMP2436]